MRGYDRDLKRSDNITLSTSESSELVIIIYNIFCVKKCYIKKILIEYFISYYIYLKTNKKHALK